MIDKINFIQIVLELFSVYFGEYEISKCDLFYFLKTYYRHIFLYRDFTMSLLVISYTI